VCVVENDVLYGPVERWGALMVSEESDCVVEDSRPSEVLAAESHL
jgi:hypothetical protein